MLAVRLTAAVQETYPANVEKLILLDKQSSLFMLDQLHCQIVKAYVAHSVGEIHCSLRTPPMLVLDQFSAEDQKECEPW